MNVSGGMLFALVMGALGVAIALVPFWAPMVYRRIKETPEKRLLAKMLREISSPEDWEPYSDFGKDNYRHISGVEFQNWCGMRLRIDGQVIDCPDDSSMERILHKIVKSKRYEVKRQADLAALQGMTQAFQRMDTLQ